MKTEDKKIKEFDTVKTFREIKEKISKETYGMTLLAIQSLPGKSEIKSFQVINHRVDSVVR
jgi:hypothetical protein